MKDDKPEELHNEIDEHLQLVNEISKSLVMVREWARWQRGRYEALVAEGFTPQQALYYLAVSDNGTAVAPEDREK